MSIFWRPTPPENVEGRCLKPIFSFLFERLKRIHFGFDYLKHVSANLQTEDGLDVLLCQELFDFSKQLSFDRIGNTGTALDGKFLQKFFVRYLIEALFVNNFLGVDFQLKMEYKLLARFKRRGVKHPSVEYLIFPTALNESIPQMFLQSF